MFGFSLLQVSKGLRLVSLATLVAGAGTTMAQSLPCAYVGDSIALGAGAFQPKKTTNKCPVFARNGITARRWLSLYSTGIQAEKVLLSMGSNDYGANVTREIMAMRQSIKAREVIWIAPGPQFAANRASVVQVANTFGDKVYERPNDEIGADNVHFTGRGYSRIALVLH